MPKDISTLFKERIEGNQEILDISNPDDLENSYNFVFDNSSNLETMTNIDDDFSDGKLKITSGQTTATAITSTRTTSANITKVELKINAWNFGDSIVEVSVDGGLNYFEIQRNVLYEYGDEFGNKFNYSGNNLKIKITLNSTDANPSPNVESMAVLYT